MPTISPISPPTAAPVRLFGPAVFVATAGEMTRARSTFSARERNCWASRRSDSSWPRRCSTVTRVVLMFASRSRRSVAASDLSARIVACCFWAIAKRSLFRAMLLSSKSICSFSFSIFTFV